MVTRCMELSECAYPQVKGPNPTDRGKAGSTLHLVIDGQGTPLALTITDVAALDVVQPSCMLTKGTTSGDAGSSSTAAGSSHGLLGGAWSPERPWVVTAGGSSGP